MTNYLYDIFLEDYNKDLIDVPVRMYMLSDAKKEEETEMKYWKLYRRFFLFDTITGIATDPDDFDFTPPSGKPKFVRYAKEISLHISLDRSDKKGI
jgi:hypothetical protein